MGGGAIRDSGFYHLGRRGNGNCQRWDTTRLFKPYFSGPIPTGIYGIIYRAGVCFLLERGPQGQDCFSSSYEGCVLCVASETQSRALISGESFISADPQLKKTQTLTLPFPFPGPILTYLLQMKEGREEEKKAFPGSA